MSKELLNTSTTASRALSETSQVPGRNRVEIGPKRALQTVEAVSTKSTFLREARGVARLYVTQRAKPLMPRRLVDLRRISMESLAHW